MIARRHRMVALVAACVAAIVLVPVWSASAGSGTHGPITSGQNTLGGTNGSGNGSSTHGPIPTGPNQNQTGGNPSSGSGNGSGSNNPPTRPGGGPPTRPGSGNPPPGGPGRPGEGGGTGRPGGK
jgi:hypothetical protein